MKDTERCGKKRDVRHPCSSRWLSLLSRPCSL